MTTSPHGDDWLLGVQSDVLGDLEMPLLNLESSRNEITRALDFLFQGF